MSLKTTTEPLRITVAGAGAIGTMLAARLGTAGHCISMLARGATLAAIQSEGVVLDDLSGSTQVRVQASNTPDFGVQDVVFLCSKAQDLPVIAASVQPLIGPETLIVPTPNGVPFWYFHGEGRRFDGSPVNAVDPDGVLAKYLPLSQVIGASLYLMAEAVSPGRFECHNPHLIVLGELGGAATPRLKRLCDAIGGAGIEARATDHIRDPLWTKIIANVTTNLLSVVSGATLQEIFTRPELVSRALAVMHEAMLAAACYGARLSIDPIEFVKLGAAMGPVRTSMLQDFERGKPLELAAIGDAVLELADRFSLPMKATRELVAQVRAASTASISTPTATTA
ncbi:2-dehydropantoate 2-reductase [soil metagenome]